MDEGEGGLLVDQLRFSRGKTFFFFCVFWHRVSYLTSLYERPVVSMVQPVSPRFMPWIVIARWVEHSRSSQTLVGVCSLALSHFLQRKTTPKRVFLPTLESPFEPLIGAQWLHPNKSAEQTIFVCVNTSSMGENRIRSWWDGGHKYVNSLGERNRLFVSQIQGLFGPLLAQDDVNTLIDCFRPANQI